MSDFDAVSLEDINHKLEAIMEGQTAISHLPSAVMKLQEDMDEVKADVKTIKAVVIGHSSQLNDHEGRITGLEQSI